MVKCPECKKDITSLFYVEDSTNRYIAYIEAKPNTAEAYYAELKTLHDEVIGSETVHYACCECNKILFYDNDEALAFLKGEKDE